MTLMGFSTNSYKTPVPLSKKSMETAAAEAWAKATERLRRDNDTFRLFQRTYVHDACAFIHDCVKFPRDEEPTQYQAEILSELPARGRVAVRGPHGIGKTALAAWVVLWAVLTVDDCKVPTTASAWRQLTKYLWPEVHKWAARMRWDKVGREPLTRYELLTLSLKRGATCEAFAVASDNADLIEGAHARRVVYVYDEAKAIPDATWDATEGAFSGAGADTDSEAFALAISTPGEPQGRFHDIHSRKPGYEDWWARHVTLDEAITAGRVSREWAEQRARQWGIESAVYQNRVLGEFAATGEESVIPLAWVEYANDRWREWDDLGRPVSGDHLIIGVDVARFGQDRTVLGLRVGNVVTELREYSKRDTMETTGLVVGALMMDGTAIVDVVGMGSGVVDRLRELGKSVVAFNAGEGTHRRDKSGELGFVNCRSAAWWGLRERLDPSSGEDIALPPDDNLIGDLTAPRWTVTSGGKIKVESKDDIRKRIGRSTDHGDAVVQAFFTRYQGTPDLTAAQERLTTSSRWTSQTTPRWKRSRR